jgi:hypothetical protein
MRRQITVTLLKVIARYLRSAFLKWKMGDFQADSSDLMALLSKGGVMLEQAAEKRLELQLELRELVSHTSSIKQKIDMVGLSHDRQKRLVASLDFKVYNPCYMVYGIWYMVYNPWYMVYNPLLSPTYYLLHTTYYILHTTPYTPYTPYTTIYTIYNHIHHNTIHHTPYTIRHTPYTIHHTPYNINHTPYTIQH